MNYSCRYMINIVFHRFDYIYRCVTCLICHSGQKKRVFCGDHKSSEMRSYGPKCWKCGKCATYGMPGKSLSACFHHRKSAMRAPTSKMCSFRKCSRFGPYTLASHDGKLCSRHYKELSGVRGPIKRGRKNSSRRRRTSANETE